MSEYTKEQILQHAAEILNEYSQPHIDIGNVYFAATEFRDAYQDLQTELTETKARLESAEKALEAIASYDMYSGEIGICQYGCDTPNIAREHFKKYEKESM